jgi:DNA (cytosine-5)-methyltransferase 1
MKMVDLFSGIGGFSLAARWCGIETIQFVENDGFCQKVLKKNFPSIPIHGDIKTFNPEYDVDIDIITGGFPCQPFSVSGKRKGISDDRYLWPEFRRIIEKCKPSWIIAENVIGIVAMELDNIIDDLEKYGYQVQSFIIPACAAGAAHRRDRVWIIANLDSNRCGSRIYHRQDGHIQNNQKWDIKTIQSEWEKLKHESWKVNTVQDWFGYTSEFLRDTDGIPRRLDRCRALGNAIVPQVAYVFLSLINKIGY